MNKLGKRKFQEAKTKIALRHPFYVVLIYNCDFIFTTDVPTMGTNGTRVWVNLDFVESISREEVQGVLIHEVLHIIYSHVFRRGTRDPRIFNMAADYAINPIVKSSGFTLPPNHLDEPRFHGMNAEAIYRILEKEQPPPPPGVDLTDLIDSNLSEAGRKQATQEVKINLNKALNAAGQDAPDELKRLVKDITKVKVNWREKLRDFIQVALGSDESTWKRPNRNYIHDDLYIPSLEGRVMPNIAILLDTSGSIYEQRELFDSFCAEVNKIIEDLVPEQVNIFYVDTAVRKHDTYEEGEIPEYELVGGGGTNFVSAWAKIEETAPSCIIAFTDLWATVPDSSSIETLWIVYINDRPTAPFGEITIIED